MLKFSSSDFKYGCVEKFLQSLADIATFFLYQGTVEIFSFFVKI